MSKVVSTHSTTIYDFCPIGAIIAFPATTIPPGWLECNGQAISRTAFADLFGLIGTTYGAGDVTTFNLPDYRGVFLRGNDNGKGYDAGRALGSLQQDDAKTTGQYSFAGAGFAAIGAQPVNYPMGWNKTVSSGGINTGNITLGGTETRPKNVSVIFCVKATMAMATSASTVSTFASLTHNTHQGEAASFGTNGYKRFADGTILQWGANIPTGGQQIISFPLAFPNACYMVTAGLGQYYGYRCVVGVDGVTLGSFRLTGVGSTDDFAAITANWIAIGR